jgi:uncharacterized protein
VIVPDVNLLIFATDRNAPRHYDARKWWENALSGNEQIGLAWAVLIAFLRLTTRPGLSAQPLSVQSAFSLVETWLNHPLVSIVHPGSDHARLLRRLITGAGTGGNLTSDSHLAALAIEHNAELCSFDRDFARFPDLRWRNPLP